MAASDPITFCAQSHIVSFSASLSLNKKGGKVYGLPEWKTIDATNHTQHHDPSKNAFMIRTGSINKIVVIDADEKKAAAANKPIPAEILDSLVASASLIVKTPNGRHFYFRYDGDDIRSETGASWNGVKNDFLDIRAEGGIITAPPTQYLKGGEVCRYSFLKGDTTTLTALAPLPDTVYSAITRTALDVVADLIQTHGESTQQEIVEDLLNHLAPTRWDNYSDWLKIGVILFNLGLPLQLWDSHSRISTHYTSNGCAKAWRTFRKGPLTIRTLWRMVKEDDPNAFAALQKKHINVKALLTPTHTDIAKLFYLFHSDDYVNTPQGWFERQQNNTWLLYKAEPPTLLNRISEFVSKTVDEQIAINQQMAQEETNEVRLEFLKNERGEHLKVAYQFKSYTNLKATQNLLAGHYYSNTFFDLLDSNKKLFAFNNGVYDLESAEFRPIRAEDYISFTCGYDFVPGVNEQARAEVMKCLTSMFETTEMRDYLLKKLAYCLDGDQSLQEFDFWKGKGSNGKSLLISWLSRTLGAYCRELPVAYFTHRDDSGKDTPMPALTAARGARLVWCSEPEPGATLQTGMLKKMVGGESITTRTLHKENIVFIPQFGIIFLLNDNPRLPRATEFSAIKRRMRVIPFPFQFLEEPVAEFHRPINRDYLTLVQSDEWRLEFMRILIEVYNRDVKGAERFPQPKEVKEACDEFFNENNPLAVWLYEKYDTNADAATKITATELANAYNQEHPKENRLTPKIVGNFMSALGFHTKKSNGKDAYRGISRKAEMGENDPAL